MRIIVVDDELHALHDFLSTILGVEKIEYQFFRDDPKSILQYAQENQIDGAFLDINMVAINGFELARKLLKIRPDLKISFITGLLLTEKDIPTDILLNVVSLIHKPYRREDLGEALRKFGDRKTLLEAKMFGGFDCYINGKILLFSSAKSKELFALLITNAGHSLTMATAIAALYPEKEIEKAKILYRDAVWRLRKTLEEAHCNCITFQRALLALDKSLLACDYYDLLAGKKVFREGPFLPEYEWAEPYRREIAARFGE